MNYTAREVAQRLQNEGYSDITTRTVNYYAFEKKMFDITSTGKKCFTEKEIKKIKAIKHLQKTTSFTLEQIKEIINKYDFEDVMTKVSPIVYENVDDFYQSPGYTQSLISAHTGNLVSSDCSRFFSNDFIQLNNLSDTRKSPNYLPSCENGKQRSIRVNADVTLMVSDQVDTDTLRTMVECIQEITQNQIKSRKE